MKNEFKIVQNDCLHRHPDCTVKLVTRQNGAPHNVIECTPDFAKVAGNTFALAGVYFLLPFAV